MPTYQELFNGIAALAKKYQLDSYMSGYDAELVNIFIERPGNWNKFMAADTFEKTLGMVNEALSNYATGGWMSVTVQSFITDQKDLARLFELGQEWRHMKLHEVHQKQLAAQQRQFQQFLQQQQPQQLQPQQQGQFQQQSQLQGHPVRM